MNGLIYEHFVRGAFGSDVERDGDPAGLAEAGIFGIASYLQKVKAATAYAMAIYRNNSKQEVKERMDQIICEVIDANNSDEVIKLIKEFKNLRNA